MKKPRRSPQEDKILAQDFQGNNSEAFDELILEYKDMIFNLCYRLIGDYDDANDCAQETFIKVYRNLKNFKFKSSFSTWLYRIAVNTCKNHLSSLDHRIRKKMVRLDRPGKTEERTDSIDIGDRSFNPVALFERKENEIAIQSAINTLPRNQKLLIVMRDIEGSSYEEIAEITGLKMGTIKSKLARARQRLRDRLRGVM